MKNRGLAVIAAAVLAVGALSGCSLSDQDEKKSGKTAASTEEKAEAVKAGEEKQAAPRIGIAMPDKSQRRWRKAGRRMKQLLKEEGYEAELVYGENKADVQKKQIRNMLNSDCELLIVAAVDESSLQKPITLAGEQGIPVIAYEELIEDTDGIAYYVTYDHYEAGRLQGEAIEKAVKEHSGEEPFYLEIFSGDLKDIDSYFLYEGAMEVLNPLIESGKAVVKSGQVTQAQTAVEGWSAEGAQNRMSTILATYYPPGTEVDAVLCADDSLALGVEKVLAEVDRMEYPLVTGAGCEIANIRNLAAGKQGMDVFEDPFVLAEQTVKMAVDIMKEGKTEVNAKASYDNGACVVKANLSEPKVCTPENYQELLVESGYFKQRELN